jgi:hypothetical protein
MNLKCLEEYLGDPAVAELYLNLRKEVGRLPFNKVVREGMKEYQKHHPFNVMIPLELMAHEQSVGYFLEGYILSSGYTMEDIQEKNKEYADNLLG